MQPSFNTILASELTRLEHLIQAPHATIDKRYARRTPVAKQPLFSLGFMVRFFI